MFKRYIILGSLILMPTVLILALDARNASPSIKNGYHDLTISGSGGFASYFGVEEVCSFCHAPHNTNKTETYTNDPTSGGNGGNLNGSFLWNRRVPLATNFTPYTSSTMHVSTSGGPGTTSLLCLSCHDGIGAMNVLLNYPDGMTDIPGIIGVGTADQFGDVNDPAINPLNIGDASCTGDSCTGGGNLQNDHPIGFLYSDALAADPTGLKAITNPALLGRMTVTGNKVECSTCHDPHITNDQSLRNKFLVVTNAGSALCLECHNK